MRTHRLDYEKIHLEKLQEVASIHEIYRFQSTEQYLRETEWLSDIHVNQYMSLLKKKFPLKAGFQDTHLQQVNLQNIRGNI